MLTDVCLVYVERGVTPFLRARVRFNMQTCQFYIHIHIIIKLKFQIRIHKNVCQYECVV